MPYQLASPCALSRFRDDAQGGAQVDAVHALVRYTELPEFAFGDIDPAGLLIALSLPRLYEVLASSLQNLVEIFNHKALRAVISNKWLQPITLKKIQADVCLTFLWAIIHGTGKALP